MRRLFGLVAAVVLLDSLFYSSIAPLLPHYSDELGLSKTGAGILSGSYAAGTLLASIPSGYLAARRGPKTAVMVGLGLLAVHERRVRLRPIGRRPRHAPASSRASAEPAPGPAGSRG